MSLNFEGVALREMQCQPYHGEGAARDVQIVSQRFELERLLSLHPTHTSDGSQVGFTSDFLSKVCLRATEEPGSLTPESNLWSRFGTFESARTTEVLFKDFFLDPYGGLRASLIVEGSFLKKYTYRGRGQCPDVARLGMPKSGSVLLELFAPGKDEPYPIFSSGQNVNKYGDDIARYEHRVPTSYVFNPFEEVHGFPGVRSLEVLRMTFPEDHEKKGDPYLSVYSLTSVDSSYHASPHAAASA